MSFVLPFTEQLAVPSVTMKTFLADPAKIKCNLTVGTYWNEQEKLHEFEATRQARSIVQSQKHCHNYTEQGGPEKFRRLVSELLLGPSHPALNRTSSFQTLGSSGALTIVGHILSKWLNVDTVYVSSPHWLLYSKIFPQTGVVNVKSYRYIKKCIFSLDAFVDDLYKIECQSTLILQVCCHNPTGCDPSFDDWRILANVCKEKRHRIVFDSTYHGFVSGNPVVDLAPVRLFVELGMDVLLCQSFSKNLSMYADRVGSLTAVMTSPEALTAMRNAVYAIVYHSYISPPRDPALILETILDDAKLCQLWFDELREAAERLNRIRTKLYDQLWTQLPSEHWKPILHQRGLYAFLDLDSSKVKRLRERYHVHLMHNGRLNLSGINQQNIDHVAQSLAAIVSEI